MDHQLQEIDIQHNIDRVVFIHLAKTAGTTFNALLEPVVCGMNAYPAYDLMQLLYTELDELRKYHFFSGHFSYRLFTRIFPEGFVGLTFLREPVSRTISNFKFVHELLRRDETPELSGYENELEQVKKMTLIELLENTELRFTRNFINIQTRFLGDGVQESIDEKPAGFGKLRIPPKKDVLPTRLSLELAKTRLVDIAFMGITERFQDSLFLLSYTFGWRPFLNKVHLNPTPDRGEKINISNDTRAIIKEKVALDLELYEFGQELFDQRFNEMTQTLLQRYGTKEQATLKLPLPTDVMMQLLEQHFITRRDGRYKRFVVSVGDQYEYVPSMPVEGPFGWYASDDNSGATRWSGPGLQSGFDLPCPAGKNIQISFRIVMAIQPHVMDGLALTANNEPIKLMRERQIDGSYIFTGMLPQEAIAGSFVRLIFSVPETIAPCTMDHNNDDTRLLGILINWAKLLSISDDDLREFSAHLLKDSIYFPCLQVVRPFGWYSLEHSELHGPVHWSGPELQSGFEMPCPSEPNLQVSFCVLMALHADIINQLSLTANDTTISLTHKRQPDGSYIFIGKLPANTLPESRIRFVFSVPRTIAPSSIDPNNGDNRLLGILLSWVKLHKA